MRLIHDIQEFNSPRRPKAAAAWTAIIPAAGRGSRLKSPEPKILYPVMGRPILDWLCELLRPLCRRMIFVLSPEAESRVTPRLDPEASVVLQQEPTGMADAVALCEKTVKTPYTLVLWGDQITPRRRSLAGCMTLLESDPDIQAVIPTMIRKAPYIHFKRDPRERIIEVFQARESHLALEEGESDCGAFCFRTAALFRVLRQTRGNPAHQGARTGENNFLSLLPLFHDDKAVLAAVRLHDAEETLGINTPEDASRVEAILTKRGGIE